MIKCLSVQNPLSYLICLGVKTIENRDWKQKWAEEYYNLMDGKPVDPEYLENVKAFDAIYDRVVAFEKISKENYFLAQAIIGKVTVSEIREKAHSEMWASSDYRRALSSIRFKIISRGKRKMLFHGRKVKASEKSMTKQWGGKHERRSISSLMAG